MRDTLLAKYASCTIEYPGLIERFAGVVESCTCITRYRSLTLFFKQSFQCTTHPRPKPLYIHSRAVRSFRIPLRMRLPLYPIYSVGKLLKP